MNQEDTLFGCCDMLVLEALEKLGRRIVRSDRARFAEFGRRPFFEAHTVPGWRLPESAVAKALHGAWSIVPVMMATHGCCCDVTSDAVTAMLDKYVRDIAITGTAHSPDELRYRFEGLFSHA